jgi:hypothetical protein
MRCRERSKRAASFAGAKTLVRERARLDAIAVLNEV